MKLSGKTSRRTVLKTLGAGALGGAVLPGTAAASNGTEITRVPAVDELGTTTNPCNGETVTPTGGTIQLVTKEHPDGADGWHVIVEGNFQGVTAEGSYGNRYQANGGFWKEVNAKPPFPYSLTHVGTANIVSGSAPNYITNMVHKVTINANGETTVTIEDINARCHQG